MRAMHCRLCRDELDLAQQFAYLVEAQTVDNPVMLAAIRRLPHAGGRPLRVCRGCQAGLEQRQVTARDVLTPAYQRSPLMAMALLAVGFGFLAARLG